LIDGSIGELSPFHETFGYYSQGVGADAAVLPAGWQQRLVAVDTPATRGATGWCLEPHDLALAKLVAGRDKDLKYVCEMAAHQLVDVEVLLARESGLDIDVRLRELVRSRIHALPSRGEVG